jgi:hypothetical protein
MEILKLYFRSIHLLKKPSRFLLLTMCMCVIYYAYPLFLSFILKLPVAKIASLPLIFLVFLVNTLVVLFFAVNISLYTSLSAIPKHKRESIIDGFGFFQYIKYFLFVLTTFLLTFWIYFLTKNLLCVIAVIYIFRFVHIAICWFPKANILYQIFVSIRMSLLCPIRSGISFAINIFLINIFLGLPEIISFVAMPILLGFLAQFEAVIFGKLIEKS